MDRKYKEGYTESEIKQVIKDNNVQNINRFWEALDGVTGIIIDGEILTFESDVQLALRVSKEDRDPKWYELD